MTTAPDGLFHLTRDRLTYDFDQGNRLTTIRDVAGHTTSLAYDPVTTDEFWGALLTQITDSVGRSYIVSWAVLPPVYMPPGNYHAIVALRQQATGRVIQYFDSAIPDGMGLMTLVAVSDSAYTTNQVVTYGYYLNHLNQNSYALASVVDRTGSLVYALAYDSFRHLTGYQYRNEPVVTYYRYPDAGYTDGRKAGMSKIVHFTSENRLTSSVDFDGTSITYTYDSSGSNLLQQNVVDPRGFETVTTYLTGCSCGTQKPLSILDPYGGLTQFEYDERGNMTRRQDARGSVWQYQYDAQDRLLAETDPASKTTSYAYNSLGLLATTTDAMGQVTHYAYDAFGQTTCVVDPIGGATQYEYDSGGFITRITSPRGSIETFGRDLAGRVVSYSDPMGNVTTYTYAYPASNLLSMVIRPQNLVTSYTYDYITVGGYPMLVTTGVFSPMSTRSLTYDAAGNLASDSTDSYLSYEYDVNRRVTATWRANGAHGVVVNSYDPSGNLVSVKDVAGPVSHINPANFPGVVTTFSHDGMNRLTSTAYPDGTTVGVSYDAVGNVIAQSDGYGRLTTWAFDALGRSLRRSDPMGRVTTWEYDALGRRIRETDPAMHVTLFDYDPNGRLISTSNPLGAVTTFAYDPDGDLIAISDARSHVWAFGYDAHHQLVMESDPMGHVTSYSYNPFDHVAFRKDAMGRTVAYAFDSDIRPCLVHYPNGAEVLTGYDANSDVSSVTAPGYALSQSWTHRRLSSQTYTLEATSVSVEYDYDDARRRTRVHYLGSEGRPEEASDISYTYDSRGRVARLDVVYGTGPTLTTTYSYGLDGELRTVSHSNGVLTTYAYNANDEVTRIEHRANGQLLSFFDYVYDSEGLRVARVWPAGNQNYFYDAAHRLVGSTGTEPETFAYDVVGNLVGIMNQRGTRVYAYDPANRLVSEAGNTPATYVFDANGNLNQIVRPGQVTFLDWDFQDMLTAVGVNGTVLTTFAYHPLSDLMLSKKLPEVPPRYTLWAGQNPLVDLHLGPGGPTSVTRFAATEKYDDIETIKPPAPAGPVTPLRDALQSVCQMTDPTGAVVAAFDYSAYGEPRNWMTPPGPPSRFTYTGREWDPEAGMYYYRARWYQPQTGRFASVDPQLYERQTGQSAFAYVAGMPTRYIDPTGEQVCEAICIYKIGLWITSCGLVYYAYKICTQPPSRDTQCNRAYHNCVSWFGKYQDDGLRRCFQALVKCKGNPNSTVKFPDGTVVVPCSN